MPKIRLFFARLAVVLIAAQASSSAAEPARESAAEPAAGYIDTQSATWLEYWEPCFKDRPADRIAAMRGLNAMVELFEEMAVAGEVLLALRGDATHREWMMEVEIPEEYTKIMEGAKTKRALDDIELVANYGCGAAQAVMGELRGRGLGGIEEWLESLKWMMLAEKSGFAPIQEALKREMSYHDAEDIATARAWVNDWRPSE